VSSTLALPTWPEIEGNGLALLGRLTAISSPSGDAAAVRRMADALGSELTARGMAIEIRDESDARGQAQPLLVARSSPSGRSPLLLLGHLDTVLPAAAARRDGDRVYATGANDMKGGFAAFLLALDLLRQGGREMPDDLELVAVPDEETGGAITERITRRRGAAAREVWVLEPGEMRGDAETIVGGRRGLFHWHFTAHGRSAHSGLHFWHGRSALLAAAEFARAAADLSREGRGPTVNPARLVAGSSELLARLGEPAAGDLLGSPRQVNVVPDEAGLDGEARFLRGEEAEPLRRRLLELSGEIGRRHEVGTELTLGEVVPPFDPGGPQRALGEQAVGLAARRGWSLAVETERGGISFPNFLESPGRMPVIDGLGPVGGGMHTREEHVSLRSLARRGALIADLLVERG